MKSRTTLILPVIGKRKDDTITIKLTEIIETTGQHINLTVDFLLTRQTNASCFIFFADPHFLKNNFSQPHIGTFGFAPTHKADPSAKPKEPLFQPPR